MYTYAARVEVTINLFRAPFMQLDDGIVNRSTPSSLAGYVVEPHHMDLNGLGWGD